MEMADKKSLQYAGETQMRLDKFLTDHLEEFSRVMVQQIIENGNVTVNGKNISKSALKLSDGDLVEVTLPEPQKEALSAQPQSLDVLYEDDDLLVINKPAGMVVHPGAGNLDGTLVNAVLAYLPQIRSVGEPARPGIVHRLDKDTSGVILLAKTQNAYDHLVRQFKSRKTKKTYLALVDGIPPTPTGRIEANIHRDQYLRQKMAVAYEGKGRRAISEYRTVKSYPGHTLLEVNPLTGRTHQIRVHLSYLGTPVAGDRIYGRRKASIPGKRFFLHAEKIGIELLDGSYKEFLAPLPEDLKKILDQLESE